MDFASLRQIILILIVGVLFASVIKQGILTVVKYVQFIISFVRQIIDGIGLMIDNVFELIKDILN